MYSKLNYYFVTNMFQVNSHLSIYKSTQSLMNSCVLMYYNSSECVAYLFVYIYISKYLYVAMKSMLKSISYRGPWSEDEL